MHRSGATSETAPSPQDCALRESTAATPVTTPWRHPRPSALPSPVVTSGVAAATPDVTAGTGAELVARTLRDPGLRQNQSRTSRRPRPTARPAFPPAPSQSKKAWSSEERGQILSSRSTGPLRSSVSFHRAPARSALNSIVLLRRCRSSPNNPANGPPSRE